MYERPRVNVKVERGSTFTLTRGSSYIVSILFTHVKPVQVYVHAHAKITQQWKFTLSLYKLKVVILFTDCSLNSCNIRHLSMLSWGGGVGTPQGGEVEIIGRSDAALCSSAVINISLF